MKENPLQYRVRGTPVPTTQTRGTNYPKSTAITAMLPKLEEFHWNQVAAHFEEKTINNLFNQIMLNGLKDEPEEQE